MKKINLVWAAKKVRNKEPQPCDITPIHVLSTTLAKMCNPEANITIWSNVELSGPNTKLISNFVDYKYEPYPPDNNALRLNKYQPAQISDIMRMKIIEREGGAYIDADVLFYNTPDESYWTNNVIGVESKTKVCNAAYWLNIHNEWAVDWANEIYTNFKSGWGVTSCTVPMTLAKNYPGQVLLNYDWYGTFRGAIGKQTKYIKTKYDDPVWAVKHQPYIKHELVHLFDYTKVIQITSLDDMNDWTGHTSKLFIAGKAKYW